MQSHLISFTFPFTGVAVTMIPIITGLMDAMVTVTWRGEAVIAAFMVVEIKML